MIAQYIVEDGKKRTLKEVADHITELENDKRTPPRLIYPLPEGYEYNFSGFYGQVVGIGRTGIRELHKIRG